MTTPRSVELAGKVLAVVILACIAAVFVGVAVWVLRVAFG